jgi:hypothetical protein
MLLHKVVQYDLRSGPGDNTNLSLLEDMSRHDTHLASIPNNTRTITSNHPTLALTLQGIHDPNLVSLGDTLCDRDNELDFIFDSFDNSVGGSCGGNVDD